uniref:Uncharacterized protein n=1 Tax=Arion vulgaris TaxID=1028688 RepID=A0A0B6Y8D8_9EUPU
MEDIEADCEGYRYADEGRLRPFHSDISKKHNMEEHVDSGLGSIGYLSADLNSLSLSEDLKDSSQSQVSLENFRSKPNVSSTSSGCKESDRFDSGLDNEILIEFADIAKTETEHDDCHWVSPHFSTEQIVVMFTEDEDGDNDLHMSIIHGIPEVAMQIIGLVPDWDWLNQTNNLSQTPLHIAVLTRQVSVVRRLICAGASVDVRDLSGNTPLHNACRLGYDDVVRTLMRPVELKETLQNKYDTPQQRLPQDLESRNYEGLTCLHLAAIGGHINIMQLLLSAGANVNAAEGKSGRTVLHFAADWGNIAMVGYLLSQRNIDLNARTYAGLTPMLLAQGRQNSEVVSELLNSGALYETWLLSEESDGDISDEELTEESTSGRPYPVTSQRIYHHS